jgi:hypothetical protein
MNIMKRLPIVAACAVLLAVGSALCGQDVRFLGESNGYDEQLLASYLMLPDQRLLLDLAGEWTVTIDGKSRTVRVPSNYEYEGPVVYRRTFTPGPEFRNRHFRLTCFGINFKADLRINGEFIGNQNGGYQRTDYDLNEGLILTEEPNTIEITVYGDLNVSSSIPKRSSMLLPRAYAGIFREIYLVGMPRTTIDRFTVNYTPSVDLKRCDFTVGLQVRNYDFSYQRKDTARSSLPGGGKAWRYVVELYNDEDPEPVYTNRYKKYRHTGEASGVRELNDETVLDFGHYTTAEARFSIDKPGYWHTESPYRYRLVLSLYHGEEVVDRIQQWIGLVRIEISEQYILVNNRPLTVRGLVYYEDYPGCGNTVPFAIMEEDVQRMKKLGANVVYFKHHPPHPYFLELCNRYGLLVLYESPITILTERTVTDEAYLEDFKDYLRNMVLHDRLNVCILAWGLGAGLDQDLPAAQTFVKQISQVVRSTDARPIFCNLVFGSGLRIDDVDMLNVDLRTNNALMANQFLMKVHNMYRGRPIVCTYGTQIFSNNQNGYSDPMSTKFQARFLVDLYKKIGELKLTGGIIRSYNDVRVARSHMYANPNADPTVLTSGLVTVDRRERFAYEYARALYTEDRLEPIVMGTYEVQYPKTYPIVGLFLVVLFVTVYRQNDKFKSSIFRSVSKVENFFSDVRDNRVISLWPAAANLVLSSLALAMLFSMLFFELKRSQVFDEFIGSLIPSAGLKIWLDRMAWQPEVCVFVWSLVIMAKLMGVAVLIWVLAFAFRTRVTFQQSLLAAFWSASHFVFLIPLVIVFHRLLRYDVLLVTVVLITIGMLVWYAWRLIRIFRIMYDATWLRTAAIVGGLWGLWLLFIGMQYAQRYDFYGTQSYIQHLYESGNYSNE